MYPDMSFAVISDLHYYDTSLGVNGKAFESYIKSDRKLLEDSSYIISSAIDEIIKSGVDFTLIAGDVTKDGELLCHEKVAKELSRLTAVGIKVFVVPGNHDIENPCAYKYEENGEITIPGITPVQFADMYSNFGYGDALYRDEGTLSYVAEPVKGLWLVALDTCRFRRSKLDKPEYTGGVMFKSQLLWLESILLKAKREGKAVIVLQHHGIIEHWRGQRKIHSHYLLKDYKRLGRMLASYGVTLCFTGHYHSHDITLEDYKSCGRLYDILTGSLITPPCPIRYCKITADTIKVTTVNLIDSLDKSTDFIEKGNSVVYNVIFSEAFNELRKYKVPEKDAAYIAEQIVSAFVAHIRGDEDQSLRPRFEAGKLGLWGRLVYSYEKYIIDGLWTDLPPSDNNAEIYLG